MSAQLLEKYLGSWPVNNVSAALIGSHNETLGDADRVYELASVTKLLTAYAVLLAVEEGAFALDDAVGPETVSYTHLTLPTNREV